jgi:hypothetical protein
MNEQMHQMKDEMQSTGKGLSNENRVLHQELDKANQKNEELEREKVEMMA